MYKLMTSPDASVVLENEVVAKPVATLKDEYGGVSHIIIDDHCYVLVNGSYVAGFVAARHWYREAVEALRTLPNP